MTKTPLIISTDPGIDDAVAITIALFAKQLDVKLIVPTWGNVSLPKTLTNTLKLLAFLGKTVPVVRGASQPLLRSAISAADVHGESGLAGFAFPAAATTCLQPGLAATAIHEVVAASSEPVTLMQIGPATDFALYFNQYPDDLAHIKELVIMGGAISAGNWGPYAEYNVAGDPEAAQMVFKSGLKIRVAPLELGHQAYVDQTVLKQIEQTGHVGHMIAALLTNLHDWNTNQGVEIYDALAAGILLNPDMYEFKPAFVNIETTHAYTYGASVMDFDHFFKQQPNAEIGVTIHRTDFSNWLLATIAAIPQGH